MEQIQNRKREIEARNDVVLSSAASGCSSVHHAALGILENPQSIICVARLNMERPIIPGRGTGRRKKILPDPQNKTDNISS